MEDHPRTCKWLITMVIVGPLSRVIPLPNGRFMAYKWGVITSYQPLTNWDDPPSTVNLMMRVSPNKQHVVFRSVIEVSKVVFCVEIYHLACLKIPSKSVENHPYEPTLLSTCASN